MAEDSYQFGSKLFIPKSGRKIVPPVKLHCHSWPWCGSLTFHAIIGSGTRFDCYVLGACGSTSHSQKEKLRFLCFVRRIEVWNIPHIQCSWFLPCLEVVFAHTIIGIFTDMVLYIPQIRGMICTYKILTVTHFLCARYTLNKITLILCMLCYTCHSRYILYLVSLFFLPECRFSIEVNGWQIQVKGSYNWWAKNTGDPASLYKLTKSVPDH